MIRVVLQGRTGNNFFQYAAARWLAERHGTKVVLDGSWLRTQNWAQAQSMKRLALKMRLCRWPLWIGPVLRVAAGKHPSEFVTKSVYCESTSDHAFDPAFTTLPDNTLLIGYFQSPRFFSSLRDSLQNEINYRALPVGAETAETIRGMAGENSVSVHVRRGDYLRYHNFAVCTPSYYETAIQRMKERLDSPTFWIFSDDIPWCRSHFRGPEFRFVEPKESAEIPLNDMRLMSLASHHIISNSSYSWWAAWLHWTPEKLVMVPDRWLLTTPRIPVHEKIENGWEIIDTGHHQAAETQPS